ncbi:hypothetical protein TKWG_09905 [Advenella kashmirensis WT001]|uniref:Uncharacterized protein n=1 Tax=Advenella kashmirensis (strain DSM 17095 / LMG 22695 / WT001) TaxID=1036672 RepID=I3UB83_ADVKW|nr:hypothetical protein TKWG_09905 [Advenella kashmirensis WT001]
MVNMGNNREITYMLHKKRKSAVLALTQMSTHACFTTVRMPGASGMVWLQSLHPDCGLARKYHEPDCYSGSDSKKGAHEAPLGLHIVL